MCFSRTFSRHIEQVPNTFPWMSVLKNSIQAAAALFRHETPIMKAQRQKVAAAVNDTIGVCTHTAPSCTHSQPDDEELH